MKTKVQFAALANIYSYYNKTLFENKLPECMVSIVRSNRYLGAFSPDKWKKKDANGHPICEILLDAAGMRRDEKDWHSTIVHEQVHLLEYQFFGKCGSRGYHTKRWGHLMKTLAGLYPSHNGKPGGLETGRSMSHYIIEGGAFEKAFNALKKKNAEKYKLPYQSLVGFINPLAVPTAAPSGPVPDNRSGIKVGYQCFCGCKVWGKPDLRLLCLECQTVFTVIPKSVKSDFL